MSEKYRQRSAMTPQQQGRRQKRNSVYLKLFISPASIESVESIIIEYMKWITLKSKNLPIIALEVDRAIEIFTGLLERAETLGGREDIAEVQKLKEDLQLRIGQLDKYYKEHSLDENISIFHMLKMKLVKVLFLAGRPKQKSQMTEKAQLLQDSPEGLFHESDVKWLDQPLFAYYENSPRKKESLDKKSSSLALQKQQTEIKINKKQEKTVPKLQKTKSEIKGNSKTVQGSKKQVVNKKVPAHKPQVLKFKSSSKSGMLQGLQTPAFGQESVDPAQLLQEMRKSSELKFTIKMTKQQYKQLLELKKQMKQPNKM